MTFSGDCSHPPISVFPSFISSPSSAGLAELVVFHTHVFGMWWSSEERNGSFSPPLWFLLASCPADLQAMEAKASVFVSWQII